MKCTIQKWKCHNLTQLNLNNQLSKQQIDFSISIKYQNYGGINWACIPVCSTSDPLLNGSNYSMYNET